MFVGATLDLGSCANTAQTNVTAFAGSSVFFCETCSQKLAVAQKLKQGLTNHAVKVEVHKTTHAADTMLSCSERHAQV